MSGIALAWVASLGRIGNQTAKQLLQFYSAQNFSKPGFEFSNDRLANQLDVSVRSIQKAHQFLIEKKYLLKEARYNKNGRQLTSIFYMNIPQEFVDKYFGEGELKTPLGVNVVHPPHERSSPLNNKYNNKHNNKKRASRGVITPKKDQKPALASVENQSNSFKPDKPGRAIKASTIIEEAMRMLSTTGHH